MASSAPLVVLVAPGQSVHARRWATFLAGAGHRVTVVTPTPMAAAVPAVCERLVPGRCLPPAVRNAVGAVWIRGVLRQARPDAVHVHSLGANAVLAVGVPARLLVVTPWGSDIAALRGRPARRLLVAHSVRRARRVVTTSRDMAVQAVALGARPERVSTISWGVDDAVFRPPVTPADGVCINGDTVIGPNTIVNTGASVDHDCRIGAHVHVASRVRLAGGVAVGEGVLLGIGTVVTPMRSIGAWAVCGAGAAVVGDVPPSVVAKGVPARWAPAIGDGARDTVHRAGRPR